MARLRPVNVINVLSFEEKTRFTTFFMLLVEVDARLPKTTQPKTKKRATQQVKHKPIKPAFAKASADKQCCYIKCINDKNFPPCSSSRTARRDLYLIDILLKLIYYSISFNL